MCLGYPASSSGGPHGGRSLLFGPRRLSELQLGFSRSARNNTCSPWPLAANSSAKSSALLLKGLAITLAGACGARGS